MSHARHLAWLEISFLLGVACGAAPWAWVAALLVASFLVAIRLFGVHALLFAISIVCAVFFGVVRFHTSQSWSLNDGLLRFHGTTAIFEGVVDAEADRRLTAQRLTIRVDQVGDDSGQGLRGRLLLVTDLYPIYSYGERLRFRCKLSRPEPVDRFAYDEYLALSRIYSLCRSPVILSQTTGTTTMRGLLFRVKEWGIHRLAQLLPEPHASLLAGILVGSRQGLSDNLTLAFQRTGVSHIIALSGYNITILVAAVLGATVRVGGNRRHAYWVANTILFGFIVMTGASASVVRAGVMGYLVLLARHVGRPSRIWYALLFAATGMVIINPRVLLHDVGFQLSFLATLGLLLFARPIAGALRFVPERFGLRESLSSTLAATGMTLPLLALQFGRLSLVSPVVNLLVLPVVPLTMFLGACMLLPYVGQIAAACCWVPLTWMLLCIETISHMSWSSVAVPALPQWTLAMCYVFFGAAILGWRYRGRVA